jgi:uncharacterized protein YjbI with pentapeptide repeats
MNHLARVPAGSGIALLRLPACAFDFRLFLLSVLLWTAVCAHAAPASCPAATGKNFSGQDLRNHNFHSDPPGSLVRANFANAKLSGAVFSGQDLNGASFENADLGPSRAPVDFTNSVLNNTCFIRANLDQTDFSFARMTCVDFSETSLMLASFGPRQNILAGQNCRMKFVGATLDVHLITIDSSGKSNWSKSDFTNANFQNLSPSTFSLAGKDITGAILAGTNFAGIDMTGANLTDVDFSRAVLTRAKLDRAALNGAKLYNTNAASATFKCAQFYGTGGGQQKMPDGTTCGKPLATTDATGSADLTYATLYNTDFTAAILDHAKLSGSNLNRAILVNASLVQANLQSTPGPSGTIDAANVQFADFTNAQLVNAQLASVIFSGGTLTGAVFDRTTLNGTRFDNATMPTASFQSATLQAVSFGAAILQGAKFNGATIQAPSGGQGFAVNFQCAQLGGANFKDAVVTGGNFSAAVMPAAADCCTQKGGGVWCGNIDITQGTYGAVTFPVLNSLVTCPSNEVAKCSGPQWKISPDWKTTACSNDGSLQTMWSKPNCDGEPGQIVVFKDKNLKACILRTLPGQTEVLVSTAGQVRQVVCPFQGISDITGLENFTSLTKLDLSGNQLTSFTLDFGRSVNSQLQSLDISNNTQLKTLDLRAHSRLLMLSAANDQLSSISLNANVYLVVLVASHNQIASFDLAIQNNLAYVDLSYNKLTTVLDSYNHDLTQLPNLTYLDLSHNAMTTIGSVQSLAWNRKTSSGGALQSLFLACNPKFDCSTLKVYDGTTYPAAGTSLCSRYDPGQSRWNPIANPDCPPGGADRERKKQP